MLAYFASSYKETCMNGHSAWTSRVGEKESGNGNFKGPHYSDQLQLFRKSELRGKILKRFSRILAPSYTQNSRLTFLNRSKASGFLRVASL